MFYCCLVTKWCLTLYDPMDCSLTGSSVHEISQAMILEWVAISFSRRSSWRRDGTWVSCTEVGFFTSELPGKPNQRDDSRENQVLQLLLLFRCSVTSSSSQPCGLRPTRLCPWDFPGNNTEVGCHFLPHENPLRGKIVFSRKCVIKLDTYMQKNQAGPSCCTRYNS